MRHWLEKKWERFVAWWNGWERVSGIEPSDVLPCRWCKQVKATTVSSVWSRAFPQGERVRLCDDCGSMCAGG